MCLLHKSTILENKKHHPLGFPGCCPSRKVLMCLLPPYGISLLLAPWFLFLQPHPCPNSEFK